MEFRILGPFEVEEDGRPIPLAGPKQRALLALLLLARGRPVSTDRLIEDIWDGAPPETALKSVQVYVSQLRKALGDGRLVTRERGYELVVAAGEVDSDRFDAFVRAAAGAPPAEVAACLREALALFRGEPLADFGLAPWAAPEIARLEERRLEVLEARIDADLALGRHRELVAELESLVAAQPYREHLLAQLVIALYGSGRQADALDAHRRAAARLRSELGLEPSRPLQELEQRILRQDPGLDPPAPAAAPREARRRGWRLVVAGAGMVVAAAVVAVAVILIRGSNASLASVPPGIAIVDTASGHLVAQIPTSDIASPEEAITGNGSFWVWTPDGSSLVRIDPGDGRILRRIGSPLGPATQWFLVDGRSVWFSGSLLVRADIGLRQETRRYQLTAPGHDDGLTGIAAGDGSLWLVRQAGGEALRVDPATGRVQQRFSKLNTPYAVVYGNGAAWVQSFDGVQRIDAATNSVTSVPVPPPLSTIALGGGDVWTSNETKGTVTKIDRSGRIVDTYESGDGARQMSYADGTLWVANLGAGTVTGIDTATGAQRVLRFGHPLMSLAALPGRLLVVVGQGLTPEDAIGGLKGKVARLVLPFAVFDHPDPAIQPISPFMFTVERATCAPLLGYPDAPPPRGRQLVPEAATAMPAVSSDRRTYTFTVRPGFRFAPPSNAPLDAQTFRYSIERALDPRLGERAPGAGFLADLEGIQAFRAGRAEHVTGIGVQGNRISFTLTAPSSDFLERLALPYFCPVPRTTPAVPGGVNVYLGPAPPGAGPYTLSTAINGAYSILERNPNYGGSRPQRLDAIAIREGIDTEQAIGRVASGEFDAIEHYDPLLAPGGQVARRFAAGGPLAYRAFPLRLTSYVALNAGRPPFTDPGLRRAVAAALDRAKLAAVWTQLPTDRLLPPTVRGGRAGAPGRRDLLRARRLAGPRRVIVRMAVQSGDDRSRRFADVVRSELLPLGIDVQPASVTDLRTALRDPGAGIQLAAVNTTYAEQAPLLAEPSADPASFLAQLLGEVPAAWLPPSTLGAFDRLARLTGPARDRAAVALAGRLATRDVPVVAFGSLTHGALAGPRLGCRIWNGVDPGLDIAALCLTDP